RQNERAGDDRPELRAGVEEPTRLRPAFGREESREGLDAGRVVAALEQPEHEPQEDESTQARTDGRHAGDERDNAAEYGVDDGAGPRQRMRRRDERPADEDRGQSNA